jgi:hypothetical protein
MIAKDLVKTKTFWSGLSLVIYGVVQTANNNPTEGVNSILTGLSIIFLRDGMLRSNNQ